MFQANLHPEKFQKADLRVICTLKIPAHKVGNHNRESQSPMPSGLMAVSRIARMDFLCLFPQPGLVNADRQVQVMTVIGLFLLSYVHADKTTVHLLMHRNGN